MAGMLNRHRLRPAMRMEVSSLSAASRPYTNRTAVRKPHGTEKEREKGITCKIKSTTMLGDAPLSTSRAWSSLKSWPSSISVVRASTPMNVTVKSCRRM